ncbi:DNA adenine methylase [Vagococcus carniphilus]|uniref:DNA adenine methylase n=1 Tax=Vagococcus carniphilus TaxID=218144 RepID=UPI00288E047A|nr:DNA adenine methylase [Vagococcus carniphilus]MDT2829721.1 DNA adenine methylase [Vagococcus carniphilus]MDT2839180.1 DNA adenine methylase [Vagococcus carniphilus]MDT2853238.1 DNA adenine methylase [Vagococcus carniphilus]
MPVTYSPLRYPGGKTQLSKFVANLIEINNIEGGTYIEPFAGGSGVSLQLLFENKVDHIVINDYDKSIYSVWNAIINHTDKFINLIENTPITLDEWHKQKQIYLDNRTYMNSIEGGFATFFLNRTNVSGIISGGPIGGKKQLGKYKIDCRFNKKTSINKIKAIAERRDDITLFRKDANKLVDIIQEQYNPKSTFIFFDPPYFAQGQNLYMSFINDDKHLQMKNSIDKLNDYYWILTYDAAPQIADIYQNNQNKFEYQLNYSANKKTKATEFLFSSEKTIVQSHDKVELFKI